MTAPEAFTTASKQPLTTGRRPDMAAICAKLPAGVDVNRTLGIAAVDVAALGKTPSIWARWRHRAAHRAFRPRFKCITSHVGLAR